MLPLKGERSGHLAQSSTELEDLAVDLKADLMNLKAIFYCLPALILGWQNLLFKLYQLKSVVSNRASHLASRGQAWILQSGSF